MYVVQRVKILLNRGESRSVKIGKGVRKQFSLSPIMFNLYRECLTNEAVEGFGVFKIREKIIHTVKYIDDLMLQAKEKTTTGHY